MNRNWFKSEKDLLLLLSYMPPTQSTHILLKIILKYLSHWSRVFSFIRSKNFPRLYCWKLHGRKRFIIKKKVASTPHHTYIHVLSQIILLKDVNISDLARTNKWHLFWYTILIVDYKLTNRRFWDNKLGRN